MPFTDQRYYNGFYIYRIADINFYQVSITNNHQLLTFQTLEGAKLYIDEIIAIYDKYVINSEALPVNVNHLGLCSKQS